MCGSLINSRRTELERTLTGNMFYLTTQEPSELISVLLINEHPSLVQSSKRVWLCAYVMMLQGRLNELLSQIRMHTQIPGSTFSEGRYSVEPPLMAEIHQVI